MIPFTYNEIILNKNYIINNYDQFNNDSTSRFGAKIQTVFRMNVNNQEAEAANILVNLTKKSEEKEELNEQSKKEIVEEDKEVK